MANGRSCIQGFKVWTHEGEIFTVAFDDPEAVEKKVELENDTEWFQNVLVGHLDGLVQFMKFEKNYGMPNWQEEDEMRVGLHELNVLGQGPSNAVPVIGYHKRDMVISGMKGQTVKKDGHDCISKLKIKVQMLPITRNYREIHQKVFLNKAEPRELKDVEIV